MPPSGRRRRAANKDPEQRPDADAAEAATPSRKRRRTNGTNANNESAAKRTARRASQESDATIENQGSEENEMEGEKEYRDAEAIIQRLRVAHYNVGVSLDYNNAIVPPNEQAFAKIAGRNWTYYVKTTNVIIGRPNQKAKRESAGNGHVVSTPPQGLESSFQVNIDLGPDQQISRTHAEIVYESEHQIWTLHCNGRNGLHVDESRVERGQVCTLRSGAILSILGTQMIFILPNEPPIISPNLRRQLLEEGDGEDEKYEPGDRIPQGTNVRLGGQSHGSYQSGSLSKPPAGSGSGTQAAHALTALSHSQQAPGTPRMGAPVPKSKNSPAYTVKGITIESTDEIDYSLDSAKDIKPPHSYAQMIGQAIMSREGENATLAQIYEFIKDHYAFFRHGGGGWQNSIRHNLSLSKHFEKIPRRTDEPGKGMKWQIVPEWREEYMKKNFHEHALGLNLGMRQAVGGVKRRLDSSGPNSPAVAHGAMQQSERLAGALGTEAPAYIKRHSGSPTPPRHAYPAPNESFTPERGGGGGGMRLQTGQPVFTNGITGAPLSATSGIITPTFERNNPLASQQTYSARSADREHVDSPPALLGAGNENIGLGPGMHTPLPARSAPKPFPSTVKPPSFYARDLFSSPAPYWRFADSLGVGVGSTPFKPLGDLSPEKFLIKKQEEDVKTDGVDEEIDEEAEDDEVEDDDEIKDEYEEKKEETDEKEDNVDDVPEAAVADEHGADVDETMIAPADPEDGIEIIPPSSPLKRKATTPDDDGDNDDNIAPDDSPTRTVSRPVSRREAAAPLNGVVNGVAPIPLAAASKLAPPPPKPQFNLHAGGFMRYGHGHGHGHGAQHHDDEDEDEGIDLSK